MANDPIVYYDRNGNIVGGSNSDYSISGPYVLPDFSSYYKKIEEERIELETILDSFSSNCKKLLRDLESTEGEHFLMSPNGGLVKKIKMAEIIEHHLHDMEFYKKIEDSVNE